MVSSSKILTVSYGTFSCTAEGFEDPLAVVKETTEFFRGVVSDDRFFGAEPPSFDADLATEMMRERLGAVAESGHLTLGSPRAVSAAAASAGAMAAALAAGPSRAGDAPDAAQANARAGALGLPDDDTIEATAIVTERPVAEQPVADAPLASDATDAASAFDVASDDNDPWDVALDNASVEAAPNGPFDDPFAPDPTDTSDTSATDTSAAGTALAGTALAGAALAAGAAATRALTETPSSAAAEHAAPAALEDTAPAPRPSSPDNVAAKLDRIRAVVSGNATPADAPADPVADASPSAPTDPAEADENDALSALLGELENDLDSPELAPETPPSDTAAEPTEASGSGMDLLSDSIASLLGAEAALTANPEAEAVPSGDEAVQDPLTDGATATAETSPEVAPDTSSETSEGPSLAAGGLAAGGLAAAATALSAFGARALSGGRDVATPASDSAEADDDSDNIFADPEAATLEAGPQTGPIPASGLPESDLADAGPATGSDPDAADAPSGDDGAPLRARVVKVKRADFLKAVETGQLEEVDEPAPADSGLSQEEEDELARELAAVKAELDGDLDAWSTEEARAQDNTSDVPAPLRLDNPVALPDDTPAPDDAPHGWATDLDAIDARTSAELGQPAADTPEAPSEATIAAPLEEGIRDTARKTVKMASPARALLTEQEVGEGDASRLMDRTDSAMDEPEGNRRRTAIAHLRAAVAATKADRLLGRKPDAQEDQEPYREDLANVVRPRRPQPGTTRSERPTEAADPRPAPLKLVAEQRVAQAAESAAQTLAESPAESPSGTLAPATMPGALPRTAPVRPRRVRRAAETEATGAADTGFVDYARSVGATDLPELLEAAAAYMSYVEGRDQFSRPQLMSTVRQAEAEESSREDRLRSFGQLLREGKIQKTTGGRFTASDRISFKPDRAAV